VSRYGVLIGKYASQKKNDKSVNHKSTLKCLSKCSKWRLSKKRGLVADGWMTLRCTAHVTASKAQLDSLLDLTMTSPLLGRSQS
jgi:hypothetical protein